MKKEITLKNGKKVIVYKHSLTHGYVNADDCTTIYPIEEIEKIRDLKEV